MKIMTKKRFLTICLSAFLSVGMFAKAQTQQNNSQKINTEGVPVSKKQMRQQRPTYINIGVGLNSSQFRDFATSPLFYNGSVTQVSLTRLKKDIARESELGLTYDFGKYETTFNENTTVSAVKRVEFFYSKLYQVNKLSTSSFNTKIGLELNGTVNIRNNPSLQNNAFGSEFFGNLLGSVKFTKDISRTQAKEKKFLFIKYTLPERERDLAFRLNLGLINSSFRNGYVYSGQSQVLNNPQTFEGYNLVFSGFRMSSRFDYTRYLKNKNAIQVSYLFDAYKTGEKLDKFEMAHNTIRLSLLFNTNNH